ncbi:MAG: transcription elongation factor GreA [Microbacteriaceae bacterium]
MSHETTVTWLTQEAYDRLNNELQHLTTEGRVDIAKKIEIAREEGDLKENGGYHAAKEEQGMQEARIRQLEELLKNSVVGTPEGDAAIIRQGSLITGSIAGNKQTFLLGSREIAAGDDFDVYSAQSPLGSAILGLKAGDETSFQAPNGKTIPVKISHVERYQG